MNKNERTKLQGQLMNAALNGGEAALWGMARSKGKSSELALEVLELATSPFHDVSLVQAILAVCSEK